MEAISIQKLQEFDGDLGDFLQQLDNIEGMGVHETLIQGISRNHPVLKLYKGDKLVAEIPPSGKVPFILAVGYRFTRDVIDKGSMSLYDLCQLDIGWKRCEDNPSVSDMVKRELEKLGDLGILERVRGGLGEQKYKLGNTEGYKVMYRNSR